MSDECSSEFSGSTNSTLGIRIGGAIGILFASLIGFSLPFITGERFRNVFFLFRTFAAGVVLSTVFIHILPDAHEVLTNPCLKLSTEYPWAFLIALSSSLFTFCFENHLKMFLARTMDRSSPSKDIEELKPVEEEERDRILKFRVCAYTLETGIIFHSIFIGLSLGTNFEKETARTLVIAMIFHQGFEGVSLGAAFKETKLNSIYILGMGLAFSLTTPLGVGIGIGIGTSYNANSRAVLGIEGVFNAFSAGILLFTGYVDLLLPAFEAEKESRRGFVLNSFGYFSLVLGAGVLALIGKWA